MYTMPNERTINVKMKRIDLCNLLIATTALAHEIGEDSKWAKLHEILKAQLDEHDAKFNDAE